MNDARVRGPIWHSRPTDVAPSSARRTVCAASRSVDLLVTRLSGGTVDPERALDEVQARGDLGQLGQQLVLVG